MEGPVRPSQIKGLYSLKGIASQQSDTPKVSLEKEVHLKMI